MAQQGGLGNVFVALQQQHPAAVLTGGDIGHRHLQIHGQSLGKAQRHRGASSQLLGLRVGNRRGVVPPVAIDQLAHIGLRALLGPQAAQLAWRQLRQCFRRQHGLIAVADGGVNPRPRRGNGRPVQRAFHLADLLLSGLDIGLDLLLRLRGIVALQNGPLQRGQLLLRAAVFSPGHRLAQRQNVAVDAGIQFQRRIGIQIGDQ